MNYIFSISHRHTVSVNRVDFQIRVLLNKQRLCDNRRRFANRTAVAASRATIFARFGIGYFVDRLSAQSLLCQNVLLAVYRVQVVYLKREESDSL